MSDTEAAVPDDEDDLEQIEGPTFWPQAFSTGVRALVVLVPIAGLATGVGAVSRARGGMAADDFEALAIGAGACLAFITLFAVWVAWFNAKTFRAQRTSWIVARHPPRSRTGALAWSCALAKKKAAFVGSLHVLDRRMRFFSHWPVGGGTMGVPVSDPMFELDLEQVRAVEVQPSASAREWFYVGSTLVVLLLRDGRQVRLATPAAELLAGHLRELCGRAEATPLGPPLELDAASTREIASVLARKNPTVALVVLEKDAKTPFVLLHGNNEALRGALELAKDSLARERDALAPYAAARVEPAPDQGSARS